MEGGDRGEGLAQLFRDWHRRRSVKAQETRHTHTHTIGYGNGMWQRQGLVSTSRAADVASASATAAASEAAAAGNSDIINERPACNYVKLEPASLCGMTLSGCFLRNAAVQRYHGDKVAQNSSRWRRKAREKMSEQRRKRNHGRFLAAAGQPSRVIRPIRERLVGVPGRGYTTRHRHGTAPRATAPLRPEPALPTWPRALILLLLLLLLICFPLCFPPSFVVLTIRICVENFSLIHQLFKYSPNCFRGLKEIPKSSLDFLRHSSEISITPILLSFFTIIL